MCGKQAVSVHVLITICPNPELHMSVCHSLQYLRTLTLRLLGDGHAQPLQVDAVLAADAGGPAAEGMEGDGAYD